MKLLAFILCCLLTLNLGANEVHKLTVNGSASVKKPADELHMTIGVVSQNQDVQKAIQDNRKKMVQVLGVIKKTGLSEKEYQTGTYQIDPQYEPPPKETHPNWRPAIIGYEVRNTLTIKTTKIDLAGSIIDAVAKEGANLVEEISFGLQDTQQAKTEAIALAVAQARAFAESAAQAAQIHLGDIVDLAINPLSIVPRAMRMEKFAAVAETPTPLTPGDVEVSASVSIIYEIIKD